MTQDASIDAARAAWSRKHRFTVLDAGFSRGEHFARLLAAWRDDAHRPAALHVVGDVDQFSNLVDAQGIDAGSPAWLAQARKSDPLAVAALRLPGVHRLAFEGGAVTLTLAVGEVARRGGVVARIDHVLACGATDAATVSTVTSPTASWGCEPAGTGTVVVVGAGLAGLSTAAALARRGWDVTVLDPGWAQGARSVHDGHLAAALTPVASRDDNARARLSRAGAICAQRVWRDIPESVVTRCGAIQLQRIDGRVVDFAALTAALDLPTDWLRFVDPPQASAIAGIAIGRAGLYFPTAMRVQVQAFLGFLAATPGVRILPVRAHAVREQAGGWVVTDDGGREVARGDQVVLANAAGACDVLRASGYLRPGARLNGMHALAGEVTMLPARGALARLRCIVSGDGYVLPGVDGWCVVGGTYVRAAASAEVTQSGQVSNLERARGLLPEVLPQSGLTHTGAMPGWAGWRAVLPGRLPAIGPVAGVTGLWVATGFASRGLTWSGLAAELIGAALAGEPLMLERDLLEEITPN